MVFSTPTFIFLFLPIMLIVYYLSSPKLRNLVLFLGSLVFYAWGEISYIFIMLFSTFFDYYNALYIEKFRKESREGDARKVLILSIVVNLSILAFFKYANFFIGNINNIFNINIDLLNISLPIGISFYTFQTMSYTIDVYREDVRAQRDIVNFGAYVTLFPQLVAGPIVRYQDVARDLESREHSLDQFSYGVKRFTQGMFKKIILANNIGSIWEEVSTYNLGKLSIGGAWFGALAYAFQIYFDFSGYSDMAIGLGSIFAFNFSKNFDYPYMSKSITEFWRRWHISLGTWFKEYVYIPLGGSKRGDLILVRNLLIVWMLTGFWHGANWNFIFWGLYFGIILIIEKLYLLDRMEKFPKLIRHLYSIILILIGWVIFAFEDLGDIASYLSSMFGLNKNPLISRDLIYLSRTHLVLLVLCFIGSTPLLKELRKTLREKKSYPLVELILYSSMILISIVFLIGSSYNPFLYFKF